MYGVKATKDNIGSGIYPFYRPLFLTATPKAPNYVKVRQFLECVLTDEAQSIIDSAGTVTLQKCRGLKDKFKFWETKDRIVNFSPLP